MEQGIKMKLKQYLNEYGFSKGIKKALDTKARTATWKIVNNQGEIISTIYDPLKTYTTAYKAWNNEKRDDYYIVNIKKSNEKKGLATVILIDQKPPKFKHFKIFSDGTLDKDYKEK